MNHVFGQHNNCSQYFCNRSEEPNEILELSENFLNHVTNVLLDRNSNIVEQFNSIIAKFVGGKRINYSLSNSYKVRCAIAVVSHNIRMPHTSFTEILPNTNSKIIRKIEIRRHEKVKKIVCLDKACFVKN